jgi:hypothetical protein
VHHSGLCNQEDYGGGALNGNFPIPEPVFDSRHQNGFIDRYPFPDCRWCLSLLAIGSRRAANIAHAITAPADVMGYLVPVSYLLGVQSLHGWYQVPVALHWGGNFLEFSSISTLSLVFVRFNPQS